MKTDLEIQKDVLTELKQDHHIHANYIGVEVSKGVVTLSGHVESYFEKWKAEKATKQVQGVHALAQEINVILPGSSSRSDSEIAHQIKSLINWSNIDPNNKIKAKVEEGFVTLGGTVDSHSQRELVQHLIANLIGITGICNLIDIEPKLSIPLVKKGITGSFRRQAIDEANNLEIAIDNNIVTLSGKVHSWSERNLAINAAWEITSVKEVVDRIQIVN